MKRCTECNKAFEDKARKSQKNAIKSVIKTSKPHVFNRRQKRSRIKVWQMLLLIAAILLFASVFAVLIFGGQSPDGTPVAEIKPILFSK